MHPSLVHGYTSPSTEINSSLLFLDFLVFYSNTWSSIPSLFQHISSPSGFVYQQPLKSCWLVHASISDQLTWRPVRLRDFKPTHPPTGLNFPSSKSSSVRSEGNSWSLFEVQLAQFPVQSSLLSLVVHCPGAKLVKTSVTSSHTASPVPECLPEHVLSSSANYKAGKAR